MNFLAHIFLSGDSEAVRIGNFIGDAVKGSHYNQYNEAVQTGILLHRQIDSYTDSHPVVMRTKERLRPNYRKYAGVVGDVFYDHFLATHWSDYSDVPLHTFVAEAYALFEKEQAMMPERVQFMLPYMIKHNWLVSYAQIEGIESALRGLARRTTFESNMELAGKDLREDYEAYKHDFQEFFPDVMEISRQYLRSNTTI